MDAPPPGSKLVALTEERVLSASPSRTWALWATRSGFESWWAPEGFVLTIQALEVRVGGRIDLRYEEVGAARNPAWAGELRAKGQGTSFTARGYFTEVEPLRRLGFRQELDFGRAGKPQEYQLTAEFSSVEGGTRVRLTAEASPTKHWALLGRSNLKGQLERLARAVEAAAG